MWIQRRSGTPAIGVPEVFAHDLAAILGVDPYRSRSSLGEEEARRAYDRLRKESRRRHRQHVQTAGGDDTAWKQARVRALAERDPWLTHLDAVASLIAEGGEIEVLGD